MSAITNRYFNELIARLSASRDRLASAMEKAADLIAAAARADQRVYVFGTGHSHMMAEELHYRAGGLAITVPILSSAIMLQDGAVASSQFERIEGAVQPILDRYKIADGDVLIVVSNSGVNAAPIEAARYGREKGASIIALTSVTYSNAVANGRTQLHSLADVVLDNDAPAGDAVLQLETSALKVGPVSTALGVTILNAIFADVAARLVGSGDAPIYLSANMPGSSEINHDLVARYRDRNPHL